MRSFRKLAALRLTEGIRIHSGRRALRCFQNELHHLFQFVPEVVLAALRDNWWILWQAPDSGGEGEDVPRAACHRKID